jgi:hypothetical protein
MTREPWDGNEWQEHCCQLLQMKYGPHIQIIPDRDRGDGGLEAYHFDGTGYQCYAPEELYSVSKLTDAQKSKIAEDIGKLNKNPERTRRLLGTVVLKKWVLLTPYLYSKDLVEYARKKSISVRSANPRPFWCDQTFEIVISDDKMFAFELAQLLGRVDNRIYIESPETSDDDIFAATQGGIAERLTKKLAEEPRFAADNDRLGRYKSSLLIDYVRGRDQFEELGNSYPNVYRNVQRRYKSTLNGLHRELEGTPGAGPTVIETLLRRLQGELERDAPGLSPMMYEELARYAVALWFVECPLYFPAAA